MTKTTLDPKGRFSVIMLVILSAKRSDAMFQGFGAHPLVASFLMPLSAHSD
jgi:hypothetical protein